MSIFTPGNTYGCLQNKINTVPAKSMRIFLMLFLFITSFIPRVYSQGSPPACDVISAGANCTSSLQAYFNQQIPYTANLVNSSSATYLWEFTANSSGAFIVSGQGTLHPIVNAGTNSGQYTLRLTVNTSQGTTSCSSSLVVGCIMANTVFSPISCFGGTSTLTITASGATAPYTYTLQPGNITNNTGIFMGLPAGTYDISISSPSGCVVTTAVQITQPSAALTATTTQTNVGCFGGSTGSVDLSVSGGTAPFTYLWVTLDGTIPAGQSTAQDLSGLVPGTYRVYVTDANACSTIKTVMITQPVTALGASYVQVNPGCDSIGIINLSPFGGTSAYTYIWTATNGGIVPAGQVNTQDLYNIVPGTYSVVVTDANGCTITKTVVLTQSSGSLTATFTQTNVGCSGGSGGSINLTVSGGTLPYTYFWTASNGGIVPAGQSTGQDLSGLAAGIYHVVVTSSNGGCVTTKNVLITSGLLNITYTQINQGCGSLGSIHVNVAGGNPPYTYVWTASNGGIVPAGQANNKDLQDLVAGTYTIVVTDAIGCTGTRTVTITQSGSGISITATPTNVLCFGDSTGAVNVLVNGGVGQYTYHWTATLGGFIPAGQVNNQNLTGLTAGVYIVSVIGSNGCSGHKTVIVLQPLPVILTAIQDPPHGCGTATASINLIVVGGNAPYTYVWTAGNGGIVPSGQANNQDLTGLVEGSYTVVVTTAHGCIATKTFTVHCTHPVFGCSHGFWKNHTQYWNQLSTYTVSHMPANLSFITTTNFYTYFNIALGTAGLPNSLTMLGALQLHGGQCNAFSRDAVAALLDVASGQNVPFPAGTNDFTSLYHAIRNALLTSDCNGSLREGLKEIVNYCHDDDDDDDRVNPAGNNMVTILAYPNPFDSYTGKISFKIKSELAGDASFELFDLMGVKLGLLFNGHLDKNVEKILTYTVPTKNKKTLLYKLKIGNTINSGKVLFLN